MLKPLQDHQFARITNTTSIQRKEKGVKAVKLLGCLLHVEDFISTILTSQKNHMAALINMFYSVK